MYQHQLDQAWSYARSVIHVFRATGGTLHGEYFITSALDNLGKIDAILWEAKDQGVEPNNELIESLLDDALDSLNVVNNRARSE